jgi:hypothetical protein
LFPSISRQELFLLETESIGADPVATKKPSITKSSESASVDSYMERLVHPLKEVAMALRQTILRADPAIGEEIKWNAPAFFYTGEMKPFNPKEYKRYLVVFNLFKKDCIRLVFWGGAKADDKSGFLEGDYADGRRLAVFHGLQDVRSKKKVLQNTLKLQLKLLDKT